MRIAVDTNIIVRFLTKDDEVQYFNTTRISILPLETYLPLFINMVVMRDEFQSAWKSHHK